MKRFVNIIIIRFSNFAVFQFFPKYVKEIVYKLIIKSPMSYLNFNNIVLPAKYLRYCGNKFKDNKFFLSSAFKEANRLVKHFGLNINSCVLDVGCGVGRLPIGIFNQIGEIKKYIGIDVSARAIRWCQNYLNRKHPNFRFKYINIENQRYNPHGKKIDKKFSLPFDDSEFDIIYLYSVFSHMTIVDIKLYLKEFRRLLEPSGKIFLTAFVEDGVPNMNINPTDYKMMWDGPLHCVRYEKKYFESVLKDYNFKIGKFEYGTETDGQSAFYIF